MSLVPGVRLGAYEISGVLDTGGMGEVYRAHDARLNRDVAIKVLRGDVVPDGHSRIRFEREARAVAALSHPNILAIHDVGDQDGQFFLVTELLEGETLRARLERGALPWRKAVEIATAMADGLSAAHAKGIVHRDLKPANTFLTTDGRVKILDFGLAKLREPADPAEDAAAATATQSGELVGTAAYMAPEQVAGRPVDARADLFALGCVLHEMVAGTRPFARQTAAETMAAILKEEPADLPGASEALRGLIAHCLEKDPGVRFQTARDLAFALRSLVVGPMKQLERPPQTSRFPKRLLQTLAIAALVTTVGVATWFWRREPSGDRAARAVTTRLAVDAPIGYSISPGTYAPEFAISPDGTTLAFVATSTAGERSLWIRPLGAFSAQRLDGTEGARFPFWSPDSRSIAFLSGSRLKTTHVAGGAPQSICECFPSGGPGTWSGHGVIVFSAATELRRVAASGGLATAITALNESGGEILHRYPYFLPDGQHFVYAAPNKDPHKSAIYLQSLGSPERKSLLSGLAGSARNAMYAPPGFLLYTRQATLFAQELDPVSMQLRGEPIAVADQLNVDPDLRAPFSVSANGVLVYHGGAAFRGRNQLAWYERTGRRLATVGEPGQFWQIGLSPDDKRIVTERIVGDNARPDLWILDVNGGVFSRLTFDPLVWEADAIWSPDSRRIVFSAEPFREMREIVVASGATTVLHRDTENSFPDDWSRDGRFIAFGSGRRPAQLLSMVGDRRVQSLNDSSFNKDEFHFSPDGRWIAYHSSESGEFEVYVASLGPVAEKRQVSRGGGGQPLWRNDGKELFFLTLDGRVMAVEIATGTTIKVGIPEVLFRTKVGYGVVGMNQYAVSRDGQRFLVNEVVTETAEKFNVVLNWHTDLRR